MERDLISAPLYSPKVTESACICNNLLGSFLEKKYVPGSGEAPWRHDAFPGHPYFFIYILLCKDNNVVMRNLAKTVKVGDNNAANQE